MAAVEIPAKLVMQLRAMTGLPMMKCKEALEACGGDLEASVDWLRKKGLETAAKKADREMKEGRVALRASPDGTSAAMVEVDCETEPVSGSAEFKALVDGILGLVATKTAGKGAGDVPVADVLAWPLKGGETVDATIKGLVAKIGENMALRRAAALSGGRVASYLHFNGKVGVLVEAAGPAPALSSADATTFLSELCMHIAFAKPVSVSRDEVGKALVDREMDVLREQAKQDPKMASKPAAVLDKILVGRLGKFFAERCLLEQPWFKDDAETVTAMLAAASKRAGGALAIRRFALFQVGGA